ncbi:hypothetical protein ACFRMQ_00365 [Kitasatospora sp. NPDC056783]|uniref:hypothetical protein n=1 Tax=Kitasatospora sp. NPDC056783 TaxID=3345943 RepID=UPI0036CF9AB3
MPRTDLTPTRADEPSGHEDHERSAHHENLLKDVQDWLAPVAPDGAHRVLDPGFGQSVPAVALPARAQALSAATGLPVALLEDAPAPHRIEALTDLVDGTVRYVGVRTRYRDGLHVTVRWLNPADEPPASDELRQAAASCSLFDDGLLVVDGTPLPATVYRPRHGAPVITRAAMARGWYVSVHGPDRDGIRVRLEAADRAPGPGLPRRGNAT